MSEQSRLEYVTKLAFDELNVMQIRGVIASWKDEVAHILIYLSRELDEQQKEDVENSIVEIISQFSHGVFKVEYIYLPIDQALPAINSWTYIQNVEYPQ